MLFEAKKVATEKGPAKKNKEKQYEIVMSFEESLFTQLILS